MSIGIFLFDLYGPLEVFAAERHFEEAGSKSLKHDDASSAYWLTTNLWHTDLTGSILFDVRYTSLAVQPGTAMTATKQALALATMRGFSSLATA